MTEETAASGRERWQRSYERSSKRDADYTTLSGVEVDPLYGPPDGGAPGTWRR
jgi:methylmalonyl-CoA mutase, N-terminal domain